MSSTAPSVVDHHPGLQVVHQQPREQVLCDLPRRLVAEVLRPDLVVGTET